jgi:ATP-dependent Clp protease ATP-binding subunit ClpC
MNRLLRNTLRPEFVNRIDEVTLFRSLGKGQIAEIALLFLDHTSRRLKTQGVAIEFTDAAVALIAEEGFDPEFGARPLRRTIQRRVDNVLSRMVLDGSLKPGDEVAVGVEQDGLGFKVIHGARGGKGRVG